MVFAILKALVAGVLVAIPIGPILVMVIQRTLCYGPRCGRMVGYGAATADTIFAAIGLLALSLLKEFIERNQGWILLVGGLLVGVIGVGMLLRPVAVNLQDEPARMSPWTCYWQGLGTTLSNPLALGIMMTLLAMFGLAEQGGFLPVVLAPLVGLGECIYWFSVSAVLARYLRLNMRTLRILSAVAGAVVCVFGIVLVLRGLLLLIGS
ncbi:MAG: LysE family transporter [Bacteroidales bacterium]|nr:LysE family transporter [Bacteroidales bacterium]